MCHVDSKQIELFHQGNLVNMDPEVLLEPQLIYGTP